jgi:catechol 2,3-dioxygenase-like lactoylglutathione lyase family enzyme
MLGQFLEYSLAATPLAGAFEFYRALGFQTLPVGDQLEHPYIALFDGNVAVGLHDREQPGPLLTFVRPQLRDYARAFRRLGIELESERLGDDEFNHVSFTDPNGQSVALIEARTFTHGEWDRRNVSACGEFAEYSVPTDSVDASRVFWEALGLSPAAESESPHRWLRLAGRGLVLGLHEAVFRPGLMFRCTQLAARVDYLRAKGFSVRSGGPLVAHSSDIVTLTGPDGHVLYLSESTGGVGEKAG